MPLDVVKQQTPPGNTKRERTAPSSAETGLALLAIFGTGVAAFLVIPFLAVHLSQRSHLGAGAIGLLLSVWLLAGRGLPAVTGPLSDRMGPGATMLLGLALSGGGCAALTMATAAWQYPVVLLAMGLGTALFQPSSKTLLVEGVDPSRLRTYFAWRAIALNAGAGSGSALGGLLLAQLAPAGLFAIAAALHAVLMIAVIPLFRSQRSSAARSPIGWAAMASSVGDLRLHCLAAISAGYYALYAQLNVTLPLALQHQGAGSLIGLAFTLNAVVVMLGQLPLAALVRRSGTTFGNQFALGLAAAGLGFGCLSLLQVSWLALVACVVLFTLGENLVTPNLETVTSMLAPAPLSGTYFGIVSVGWALGGTAGSVAGGAILDAGFHLGMPSLLWVGCAVSGLGIAAVASLAFPRIVALDRAEDVEVASRDRLELEG